MSGKSGWCADYQGNCTSPKAHRVCQMRCDDGLLTCTCELHESPAQQGKASDLDGKMGAQDKTAPGGALTPESQGLADQEGVD